MICVTGLTIEELICFNKSVSILKKYLAIEDLRNMTIFSTSNLVTGPYTKAVSLALLVRK